MSSAVIENDAAPAPTDGNPPDTSRTSREPSPNPDDMDLSPAPDHINDQSAPQSQPMTATVSQSSEKALSNAGDSNGAAPYGTRSRNRPSGSRPNYAEDKEIDAEIEAAAKAQKSNRRTGAPSTTASSQEPETESIPATLPAPATAPTRNGTGSTINPTSTTNGVKDAGPPPGGNYNVLPPTQTSKKRKQPSSNNNNTNGIPTQPVAPKSRPTSGSRAMFVETNMLSFDRCRSRLNSKGYLVADDGTVIRPNDHMYFVCEPPGEPYYFGRIMEFLHVNNDSENPVDAVRVNWFYRPKDIQRRVQDTRVVFASMHSDQCPLTSMRGKCRIEHLSDISDVDEYRKQKDSFWFDKLYDRYMHRYYEVVPTSKVVNVPKHVKKVLDERWKFVLVEVGRGRDLTSASKMCKRCSDFAANHNSVDCAVCKNTYHMYCVRPPLLKKPARGFAWACAACSRAQDLKMEARHTPALEAEAARADQDEHLEEEEGDSPHHDQITRESSIGPEDHPPPTAAQLAQANLWQWRYLGIHSRPEDALDYDDRIYPRASSRLGPRHQANVNVWHGRPVEFVKPAEGKKKYKPTAGTKKDAKGTGATDNDKREKRPKWVLDEPLGFIARGHDEPVEVKAKKEFTAQITFMMPDRSKLDERGLDDVAVPTDFEQTLDEYIKKCDQEIAPLYGLGKGSTDLLTKAVEKLQDNKYDVEKALDAMRRLSAKTDLKQPELNREEVKRFEEGVAKYGSELHLVARHVSPTIKESRIVRFYYLWKKTDKGREIWGSYEGRKSKKDQKRYDKDGNPIKLLDEVADDADDSAFDSEKAVKIKRGFTCKFCNTNSSRIWRRAPGTGPGTLVPKDPASKTSKDKSNWLTLALCGKCAYLWRRYAIQYESIEEIGKKIAASGGRASKRKIDEELMRTVLEAQNFSGDTISRNSAQIATSAGVDVPAAMVESEEPPKKKVKGHDGTTPEIVGEKKKAASEKPAELELLKPEAPRVKEHPCAVCRTKDDPQHKMFKCRDCRLHVHAACYGVTVVPTNGPWYCDMCKNDHNTQVSTNYECVLCPVKVTPQELMEPPRVSHKKKTDREREKERAEREMVQEAGRRWREDQLSAGRPVDPREPLKRTAWNNWVHVNCAVWTKEIKFGDAEHLDAAEGVGFIPKERFDIPCKICKTTGHPTVTCHQPGCGESFHVGCAFQNEYIFGFDVTPVKVSRRDSVAVMKLDTEVGLAVPEIWCAGHEVVSKIHGIIEPTPSGLSAMQEYVRTYKQVDTSITGTVRRAAQFVYNVATTAPIPQPSNRRASIINTNLPQVNGDLAIGRNLQSSPSPISPQLDDVMDHSSGLDATAFEQSQSKQHRKCCSCFIETSPKWWIVNQAPVRPPSPRRSIEIQHAPPPPTAIAPVHIQESGHGIERPDVVMTGMTHNHKPINGIIKTEPIEVTTNDVPQSQPLDQYQCHKCHVQKRTPPSSPSQARRKERPAPPVTQHEPAPYQPGYPPMPNAYPIPRPPMEGSPHSHPSINGAATHLNPWHGGPPQWSAPSIRTNPPPSQPPAPTAAPAPIYGGPPPPPYPTHAQASHEYRYPYPNLPSHAPYSLAPPTLPPSASRPPATAPPQHSPPPSSFSHPMHLPVGPYARPVSPPQYMDRPGLTSPRSIGSLNRPYQGEPLPRPPEPPNSAYNPPRGYGPPPPPPISRPSSSSHSSMQMNSAPLDHTSHNHGHRLSHGHSRHPSTEGMHTPRMGPAGLVGPMASPSMINQTRPRTPGGPEAVKEREVRPIGPGASASPSLRNLLS